MISAKNADQVFTVVIVDDRAYLFGGHSLVRNGTSRPYGIASKCWSSIAIKLQLIVIRSVVAGC